MKLCPYCRLMPGILRVSEQRPRGVYVSSACEGCQATVDDALKVHVLMLGLRSGAITHEHLAEAARRAH